MAGNFQCPQGQICSKEYGTAVGPRNTNLYVRTSTAIRQASGGTEVSGGTTTLYTWVPDTTSGLTYGTGQGSWKPAARTNDGKKWELLKDSNGMQILGADAEKSLVSTSGNLNKNVAANTTKTLTAAGVRPDQAQKVIQSNTQTNPTEGAAGAQQGQTKPLTQEEALKNVDIQDGGVREKYKQNLSYPIYRDPKQDYIKFAMYRYSPKKVSTTAAGDEFSGRGDNRSILGSVSLPIQPSITDSNNVSWGEDKLNALAEAGTRASLSLMGGNVDAATTAVTQPLTSDPAAAKTLITTSLAQAAVGTNANLFTRLTGSIVNPNLELLFNGPSLRSFTFTFSMSAREKSEAAAIREIIRFFKQGMSVKRAKSSLYLKSPNTFGISYIYGQDGQNKDHPWLNKIKECALTSCTVNYTPAGNYATYEDGAMVQYDLSLTFSELDPIYDDDYTKLDSDKDTSIGY